MAVRVTDFINEVSFETSRVITRMSEAREAFVSDYMGFGTRRYGNYDEIQSIRYDGGQVDGVNEKLSDLWVEVGARYG